MVVNLWLSAWPATSFILPRHFFWNSASPTARTSSTIKIWFALPPVCKALRASLRQPISAHPAPRFGLPHPQDRAIEENVLICASPPALHPLGQPSVARPTGFPALRFPTGQLRMEPRADLKQRSNAPVDSLTPVPLIRRFPNLAPPSELPCGSLS
jgi:hypothetical protein